MLEIVRILFSVSWGGIDHEWFWINLSLFSSCIHNSLLHTKLLSITSLYFWLSHSWTPTGRHRWALHSKSCKFAIFNSKVGYMEGSFANSVDTRSISIALRLVAMVIPWRPQAPPFPSEPEGMATGRLLINVANTATFNQLLLQLGINQI